MMRSYKSLSLNEKIERGKSRSPELRVSCSCCVRLPSKDGRYFVLLNENRRRQGIYSATPISGALKYNDGSILIQIGARLEDPNSKDLRFFVERGKLRKFRKWFTKRIGREIDPYRELKEEFAGETGLLNDLQPEDLKTRFVGITEDERITQRAGVSGTLTHYFWEIFETEIVNDRVYDELVSKVGSSEWLFLLSREQIERERLFTALVDGQMREIAVSGKVLFQVGMKSYAG